MLWTLTKFLSRYSTGINTLTSLIQMGGGFVMEPAYQRVVIDCLNDPDETLKRKVYNLAILVTVHVASSFSNHVISFVLPLLVIYCCTCEGSYLQYVLLERIPLLSIIE